MVKKIGPDNITQVHYSGVLESHRHEIKLFLQYAVYLLPGGGGVLQREGVQEEGGSVGPHVGLGHLQTAPEEGGVEPEEHLRHAPLGVLLEVQVTQQLRRV